MKSARRIISPTGCGSPAASTTSNGTTFSRTFMCGSCGLQFTDNLGTAVAKGADLQADLRWVGGFSLEASVGYTSARFTKTSKGKLAIAGDAISGEAAINYAPGTNPPWNMAIGPQYGFKPVGSRGIRALGLGVRQPQSLAGPGAGSQFSAVQPEFLYAAVDELRFAARRRERREMADIGLLRQFVRSRTHHQLRAGAGRCYNPTSIRRCHPRCSKTTGHSGRAPSESPRRCGFPSLQLGRILGGGHPPLPLSHRPLRLDAARRFHRDGRKEVQALAEHRVGNRQRRQQAHDVRRRAA